MLYAARPWPVFPCWWADRLGCACGGRACGKNAGKHPIGHLVPRGVLDASTDANKIRGWWAKHPLANIGISTGDGLAVLDVDAEGLDALADLEAAHCKLPDTPTVLSGAGGRHYYFGGCPDWLRNSAGDLALHIDLRANGGYVIAPPSTHRSGRLYAWELTNDLSVPLAPIPQWILGLLRQSRDTAPKAERSARPGAWQLLRGPIPEGQRNDYMTRLAGWLRLYHPAPVVTALLLTINDARCSPPLNPKEVERISASVFRYPQPGVNGHPLAVVPSFKREGGGWPIKHTPTQGAVSFSPVTLVV